MPSPNKESEKKSSDQSLLYKYAGLGAQFLVLIGISVYAGYKADQWLALSFPILVWLLPLLVIAVQIYRILRETTKK